MSPQEIFSELLEIIKTSDYDSGVVAAGLVRDDKIIYKSVTQPGRIHAEYYLLKKLEEVGVAILPTDIVYATVEPCGKRTPGGVGEKMGDCTSNLIKAGVKHIIYAASDPDASETTRHKFEEAGVLFEKVSDPDIVRKSVEAFNSTCKDPTHWLPFE